MTLWPWLWPLYLKYPIWILLHLCFSNTSCFFIVHGSQVSNLGPHLSFPILLLVKNWEMGGGRNGNFCGASKAKWNIGITLSIICLSVTLCFCWHWIVPWNTSFMPVWMKLGQSKQADLLFSESLAIYMNYFAQVKSQIQTNISRHLEALRNREVWLLNQVDLLQSAKEEVLHQQQAKLNKQLGLIQSKISSLQGPQSVYYYHTYFTISRFCGRKISKSKCTIHLYTPPCPRTKSLILIWSEILQTMWEKHCYRDPYYDK